MQFRFLYLDASGAETKVSTLDELTEKVRTGVVGEDTVLYDALTREWGPARVQSAWRLIRAELDGGEEHLPAPTPRDLRLGTPPATELTLTPDFLDDEGAVTAFVAARERERRDEAQRRGTELPAPQVVRAQPISGHPTSAAVPTPSADAGHRPPSGEAMAGPSPAAGTPSSQASAGPTRVRPGTSGPADPLTKRGMRGRRRRILFRGTTLLGIVAVLLLLRAWTGAAGEADAEGLPAADLTSPATPAPVADDRLAAVLAEVEGSAFDAMVSALDSLRAVYGVTAPPDGWLEGHYLANASEYPQVPTYWERYRRYVGELRTRDDDYFRQGYVARLATAGLTGPVASIRLARAMENFDEGASARDSVYAAMDGVADAADDLHVLLLERQSDITWTPVRPGFVTRDPVLEAVPDDEGLRRELNARLDALLERMDVVRGGIPGSGTELGTAALKTLQATRRTPESDTEGGP